MLGHILAKSKWFRRFFDEQRRFTANPPVEPGTAMADRDGCLAMNRWPHRLYAPVRPCAKGYPVPARP